MNWDDVTAFQAVAAHGSFTAAAERLGVARPMVSKRIQRLEQAVGATLFVRSGRSVVLTEAGDRLLTTTRWMAEAWQHAVEDLAADQPEAAPAQHRPPVRVATHAGQAPLTAELSTFLPMLTFSTEPFAEDDSLTRLEQGDLDVVVGYWQPSAASDLDRPGIGHRILVAEPVWLAVPAASRLAQADGPVPMADLADATWVSAPGAQLRALLVEAGERAGFTPRISHVTNDSHTVRALIARLGAVSLCTPTVPSDPEVVVVPLADPPRRMLFVAWRCGFPPDLPGFGESVAAAALAWYRKRAARSPKYWHHITHHPDDFPGIAAGASAPQREPWSNTAEGTVPNELAQDLGLS